MSQPFVVLALTNESNRSCFLQGYPSVIASGRWGKPGADSHAHALRIDVRRGSIYEWPDRGAHRVALRQGQRALFAVGTATAYQGGKRLARITELHLTPPGDHGVLRLPVALLASAPRHQPIPVGVTALQAAGTH